MTTASDSTALLPGQGELAHTNCAPVPDDIYHVLFNSIDEGFCLIEVFFDANGSPIDFRFLESNPAFERHTGLFNVTGRTIRELRAEIEPHWYETYGRVARTGRPERFEAGDRGLGRVFDLYAFRVGPDERPLVAILFTNVTRRKDVEAVLEADLRDMQLLRELAVRPVARGELKEMYGSINAVSIELMRADGGCVQLYEPEVCELKMLAIQGFPPEARELFARVSMKSSTSCGRALRAGHRIILDFDDPEAEGYEDLAWCRGAGYFSAQSTPLVTRSGKLIGMLTTHWRRHHRPDDRQLRYMDLLARQAADLIEQRQADAEMKQKEERLRTLFQSMSEGFVILEALPDAAGGIADCRFMECNPAFCRFTGLDQPAGHTVRDLLPHLQPLWLENFSCAALQHRPVSFEASLAGDGRWFAVSVTPLRNHGGNRLAVVLVEITERKRSESELRAARENLEIRVAERTAELEEALQRLHLEVQQRALVEESRQDLLRRLVTGQEEERQRIARELHDNLGQYLTAVMLQLQAIQGQSGDTDDRRQGIDDLKKIVESLMVAAHRQAWELRPTELDHFGLEAALRNYLDDWSRRTGVSMHFDGDGWNDRRLDSETEVALYRVAQEALTNVARHARAQHVRVFLEIDGVMSMRIVDDGCGFVPDSIPGRLGLLGMRERMLLVGGTLQIDSQPGTGTTILATAPR